MTGSVAATIQGEAGSNPANQFAVAATIWNRLKAGTYGSSALDIVNAPNQFVGSATPNSSAQTFADAIENGTLPQFGTTGNAVNFQTAGSDTTLGRDPNAVNIGGNNFSDRFGSPTANFVPPQFGGIDFSQDPSGTTNFFDTGNGFDPLAGQHIDNSVLPDSTLGSDIVAGQAPLLGQNDTNGGTIDLSPGSPLNGLGSLFGAAGDALSGLTGGQQDSAGGWNKLVQIAGDWIVRGGLILLALILIGVAAWGLSSGKVNPARVLARATSGDL